MDKADGCGQPAAISQLFIILLGRHLSANQQNNNREIGSLVLSRQPWSWIISLIHFEPLLFAKTGYLTLL